MIRRHPCSFVAFSVILSLLLLHVILCRLDIETLLFCAAALGFIREIHWHLSCGNLGVKPYALQLLLRQHGRKVPQLSSPKERQVAFRSEASCYLEDKGVEKSAIRPNLGHFVPSSPWSLQMEAIFDADLDSYPNIFGGHASRGWTSSFLGRINMSSLPQRDPWQVDCNQRFQCCRETSMLRQAVPEICEPTSRPSSFCQSLGIFV